MRPRAVCLSSRMISSFSCIFERGILADGAKRNDAVDAGFDHCVEMFRGGGKIERLIVPELGGDGGEDAVPVNFHKEFIIYNLRGLVLSRLD